MALKVILGNLGDLYDYVAFILNQEELGEVVNVKNINTLLFDATQRFYQEEYTKILAALQIDGTPIGTKVFYDSALSVFLKQADISTTLTIPSDLFATIGGNAIIGGVPQPMDFLNEESFSKRAYNVLGPSLKRHPIFKELNGLYVVIPSSITEIKVDYLKEQVIPVFDYCQDNSGNSDDIYYMPVGYEIRNDSGTYNLYANSTDATGDYVQGNVVHYPTPSSYPYVSQSVELEYKNVDKIRIAEIIISMAAERSRELNLTQLSDQNSKA